MSNYPHCERAEQYARDVIDGTILANKWIRLACEKHLRELKGHELFYFDSDAAEMVCNFIEMMPHTKGKWARDGKKLIIEPWQSFFVVNIFGWKKKKNHVRRYSQALLWVPRKNGKSALASAIANYMFCADNEFGSEVYCGATTEKQAWEVFRPAKLMVSKTPDFGEYYGISVNASNMNIEGDGSRFEPIVGNPPDGASPQCCILDEYHEHDTDNMYDTMMTGMGAREQPLMLMITTAGDNLSGPCFSMQLDAQKVLDGAMIDDGTFSMIFGIDAGDDWSDIENIKKANPNFGISVSEDFLIAQLQRAKNNARKQSAFKTKHLNVWVGSKDAYYNVEKWNDCADTSLSLEGFFGHRIYVGMDLASRVDIAALEILVELDDGTWAEFGKYYLPEATVAEHDHYTGWMTDGLINVTDGQIIDFDEIKEDILWLCDHFEVVELGYDPFQATKLVTELMEEGVPVVEMRPTVLNFSEPMKEIDAMIRSGRIAHNGNPVMTWMMSNVTGKLDKKDNVYPNKDRPENKIDGPVALMMAVGCAMNSEDSSIDFNNLLTVTL